MASPDARPDFAWRSPLVLALAAFGIFLLVVEAARPGFFLHDDNATWFVGAYAHDFRVLAETGRVAEVNYYQYGGEPFLEQGQTAVLYPPVYLGVALAKWISGDVRWSIEWIAAEHLALGLLGFYFWLRRGGVAPGLAALGGLAWVLNPFVLIVGASWITVTYLACYLPWLFWALDRLLIRPSHLSAFFLGAILALFFLQGYVQWVLYSGLFAGFYALLQMVERTPMRRAAVAFHLAEAALVFLMFSLPLLLPMLHAMELSSVRSKPFSTVHALEYRVTGSALLRAQAGLFQTQVFGISTVILYCPALLFFPMMVARFFSVEALIRRRLFPSCSFPFLPCSFPAAGICCSR